jgi:ribonuclease HIII
MSLETQSKEQIYKLKNIVNDAGIFTDSIISKEYNHEFNAVSKKNKIKVQVYFGKKGIKVILQGDTTNEFYKQINNLLHEQQSLHLNEQTTDEPDVYIGSDECGKGDFFGPLVISAVYVDSHSKLKLRNIGVRDSKDLTDNQIVLLAKDIIKIIGDNYSVVNINPKKYNETYERFGNLNKMLNWAHSKALENLLIKTNCKTVITDKFSNKDLDVSFSSQHTDVDFIQETKAEKYIGVAAASIIARYNFINWFHVQQKKGFNLPKGSSIDTVNFARKFFKKIGDNKIDEFAKLHFKTFKKIS